MLITLPSYLNQTRQIIVIKLLQNCNKTDISGQYSRSSF